MWCSAGAYVTEPDDAEGGVDAGWGEQAPADAPPPDAMPADATPADATPADPSASDTALTQSEHASEPAAPAADARGSRPPPPPGATTSRVGVGSAAALIGRAAADAMARPPDRAPVSAPIRPHRPPMPTLGEPAPEVRTGTLRPPAAVPPPPRRLPQSPVVVLTEEARPGGGGGAPATEQPTSPTDGTGDEAVPIADVVPIVPVGIVAPTDVVIDSAPDAATSPAASPEPPPVDDAPLPSFDLDAESATAPPVAPQAAPPGLAYVPAPAPSSPGLPTSVLVIGGIVIGLLAIIVVLLAVRPEPGGMTVTAPAAAVVRDPAGSPARGEAAPVRPCKVVRPARRLADAAEIRVQPWLIADPGSARVAMGWAQSDKIAVGTLIDPDTLDAEQPYREPGRASVVSVIPTKASGTLKFVSDRSDADMAGARTVDASPAFTVGTRNKGLVIARGGGKPEDLWDLPIDGPITVPDVSAAKGTGYAVAVRAGGQSGSVFVGWLDADGRPKGPVSAVASPAFVGNPTSAASESSLLVTFAARANAEASWGVALAASKAGEAPSASQAFVIPSGAAGSEAISPAATALGGDRWLLQWTQGEKGDHTVRAQVLGSNLLALGPAIELSPPGTNAGKGNVWAAGDRAVAVFFAKTGSGHELWGVSLQCR